MPGIAALLYKTNNTWRLSFSLKKKKKNLKTKTAIYCLFTKLTVTKSKRIKKKVKK